MNHTADGGQIERGALDLSRWDIPTLLPTLIFLALFSTFMTLLFLGRPSESRFAFAGSLWVVAYSLATVLHRRFQAQRGRLSDRLQLLSKTESGRLLYVVYLHQRKIDLFLYILLFSVGSISAVAWWPSIPILSLVYGLALYFDGRTVSTVFPPQPLGLRERMWPSMLVLQPATNVPMLLQWWIHSGEVGMIILAGLFWTVQLGALGALFHFQRPSATG